MDARFPVSDAAQAYSKQNMADLLCPQGFSPLLDLRSGNYQSSDHIPKKFIPAKINRLLAGSSMFWHYIRKVVHRDRKIALRGEYSDYLWARSGLELTRLFEMYGANFHIQGLEYLQDWLVQPEKSPVVFAANHMSTLETQTLCGYITPYMPTTFVVKTALTRGYFAPLICSRPYIALERKHPLSDLKIVLEEGCQILQGKPYKPPHNGKVTKESTKSTVHTEDQRSRSIIIFPQGTREEGRFSRSRFNSIAVRLAAQAGVAVVPIALSTSFWSRSLYKATQYIPVLYPEHRVHFAFGPPITTNGSCKAAQRAIVDFICDKLRLWNIPVQN